MIVYDAYAFETNRKIDKNGFLKVKTSNITKEQVRPYLGEEIPDWRSFNLDPKKIYNVYCPKEELKKAAETFNNLPLTSEHIEVDCNDVPKDKIVGSMGDNTKLDGSFLKNSLIIYDKEDIDNVLNGSKRELSCGYRYTPVRESGEFEGQHYDFKMTDIVGNHVALVKQGRAGRDVMVADSSKNLLDVIKEKIMAVFDSDIVGDAEEKKEDEIEWITVRGNHIPVGKGQSKEEAVKSFIESKKDGDSKKEKDSDVDFIDKMREYGEKRQKIEKDYNEKYEKASEEYRSMLFNDKISREELLKKANEMNSLEKEKKDILEKFDSENKPKTDKEKESSKEEASEKKEGKQDKETAFIEAQRKWGEEQLKIEREYETKYQKASGEYQEMLFNGNVSAEDLYKKAVEMNNIQKEKTKALEDFERKNKEKYEKYIGNGKTTNDEAIPEKQDEPKKAGEESALQQGEKKMAEEVKEEVKTEEKVETPAKDKPVKDACSKDMKVEKEKSEEEVVEDEKEKDLKGKEQKAFAEGVKYGEEKEKEEPKKLDSEHESEGAKKADKEEKEKKEEMAKDSALVMDADALRAEGREMAIADFKCRDTARQNVRAIVGDVDIFAFDSAEEIYKFACKEAGLNCEEIVNFKDAFTGLQAGKAGLAMDASPVSGSNEECFKDIRLA